MNVKGLARGTKLVHDELVPYGRYGNVLYSSPSGRQLHPTVILESLEYETCALVGGNECRLCDNQPHLRYPTALEIEEMKWPAIKERK